ncbi:HD domain-containing protein [Helicovermis profundi]|uniref:HDIG domain-containing protein n=1 Tax=Helicovermis profundi TaxID=3065157 RepID=A0AAU9ESL2_9FIRM|nr:HDIG domain-containing protein [Clostridia bacterium S502]
MKKNREKAISLLYEHVESNSLIKHALAVEASMRGYAKHFGEDVEYWGIVGLLHDLDYEKYPDKHPEEGIKILKKEGYPESLINAVMGHVDSMNTPRLTKMARTLYAVDELSSFVIACVLVRPTKFEGLKVKSIKKKLKDKAFARAVDRDQILMSAEELGIEITEHIQIIINSLSEREKELVKINLSLI